MSDVYETEIEIPIKVHFTLNRKEPMTYHSPEIPAYIEVESIEIFGNKLPWEVTKEILLEHLLEIEDEILENADRVKT